jgi:hypothetical protein
MEDFNDGIDHDTKVYPYKPSKEPEQPILRTKEHALFYEKNEEVGLLVFFHNG